MKSLFPKSNVRAFTLVELLVVIVIIGILGSVITASLGSARKQARDAKRISDLKNISQAIEQYYTDKGVYPVISSGTENTDAGLCIESSTALQGILVPAFLAAIPADPLYNATDCSSDLNTSCHCYIYRTQGTSAKTKEFKLFSKTEAQSSSQQGAISEGGVYYFEVASPTETASSMTLSPVGSAAGNWFGAANNPTFSRASAAYRISGAQVGSGVPRFENLVSGLQGITIEEGTTNVCGNPNFSSGATGWYAFHQYQNFAVTTDYPKFGPNSLKCQDNNDTDKAWGVGYQQTGIAAATTYTYTYYFKTGAMAAGTTAIVNIWNNDWNEGGSSTPVSLAANTEYVISYSKSFTTPGANVHTELYLVAPSATDTTSVIYVGGLQVEQKAYATSWNTNSAARSGEALSLPVANVLAATQGTIEGIVNITAWDKALPSGVAVLWDIADSTGYNRLLLGVMPTNLWELYTVGSSGTSHLYSATMPTLGSHRILLRWSSTRLSLVVDGTEVIGQANPADLPTAFSSAKDGTLKIGCGYTGGGAQLNTQFGDIVISNIYRTNSELQSRNILTSLPVDSSTTYKLGLNGSLN